MNVAAGLYTGIVRHARLKPKKLRLRHACFWLALDIDAIDDVAAGTWIFSRNRFNFMSFYDRDHGSGNENGDGGGAVGNGILRGHVERILAGAGLNAPPATIVIFCMPRVLGYGFNPLTLYFCSDSNGVLGAVVYEVHNTFGERHSYVAEVSRDVGPVYQTAPKAFYVSPFLDMGLDYIFKVQSSADRLSLAITVADAEGPVIITSLNAHRRHLNSRALLSTWLRHPLLTLKVISAIHFHAARLWLKGIELRWRPPPPEHLATQGREREPAA